MKNALKILSSKKLGFLLIRDKKKYTKGIITDGDLRRTLDKKPDISKMLIFDLMTKRPVTITRDTMAAEALNLMEEKEITSLLVVDEKNSLLGILTLNELIKSGIS